MIFSIVLQGRLLRYNEDGYTKEMKYFNFFTTAFNLSVKLAKSQTKIYVILLIDWNLCDITFRLKFMW